MIEKPHRKYGVTAESHAIAYNRGRIARLRMERKQENPYRNDQVFHEIWLDGWEATEPPMIRSREDM